MAGSRGIERTGPGGAGGPERPRRAPDLLTLVAGVLSLAVAGITATGWVPPSPPLPDPRWVLAAVAIGVGVLLLTARVRNRR
ncbi:MAG TPA: hypothetical protein VGH99_06035 [Pseudonocardia sp.]